MLLLICGLWWIWPNYKRWNSLGNDSKNQLIEKVAPLNSLWGKKVTIFTTEPFPTRTILTSQKTSPLSLIISNLFSLLFKKNVLSNRDYLLLVCMFMCMLLFQWIVVPSFQSQGSLSTGLGKMCSLLIPNIQI